MDQVASVSNRGAETIPPRRGEILLVEDRDDVREGLAQLLEMHGFMVTEVSDAEHALTELAAQPHGFALILLDLLLPGSVGGVGFRARQLADPELASIPTIVVTASEVESPERSRLHPDAWVEKPFRFETLLELVKRYVVPEGHGILSVD
jgi:two-component system, chemotaxis family, chemotaxis protein CheY